MAFSLNVSAFNTSAKVIGHAMYKIVVSKDAANVAPTLPSFGNATVSRIGTPVNISYQGDSGTYSLGNFYFGSVTDSSITLYAYSGYSGDTKWVAHISGIEYDIS